jgi:hypothetical protein
MPETKSQDFVSGIFALNRKCKSSRSFFEILGTRLVECSSCLEIKRIQ